MPFPLVLGEAPQSTRLTPQPMPQLTPQPVPQTMPQPTPQPTPRPAAALITQLTQQPILPSPAPIPFYNYHPLFAVQRPNNYCMGLSPYYCPAFTAYLQKKQQGIRAFGRPPHDAQCPCWWLKQSGGLV
jgi:hypothetical protein